MIFIMLVVTTGVLLTVQETVRPPFPSWSCNREDRENGEYRGVLRITEAMSVVGLFCRGTATTMEIAVTMRVAGVARGGKDRKELPRVHKTVPRGVQWTFSATPQTIAEAPPY